MWAITCYYNPANVLSRKENYHRFRANLEKQKIPLMTVELAYGQAPFVLTPETDANILVQVRSSSVMWHKERLLNIALQRLPETCTKVCWMDCDILFQNNKWAQQTSDMLNKCLVVFPYRYVNYYDQHNKPLKNIRSFGSYCVDNSKNPSVRTGDLGTWGVACAMRLDMLKRMGGFYDANIIGGGDRILGYALGFGTPDPKQYSAEHFAHLERYLKGCSMFHVGALHVGALQGEVVHLWHGSTKNRQLDKRHRILIGLNYNPNLSLRINDDGCYEFNDSFRAEYNQALMDFFEKRKEDSKSRC